MKNKLSHIIDKLLLPKPSVIERTQHQLKNGDGSLNCVILGKAARPQPGIQFQFKFSPDLILDPRPSAEDDNALDLNLTPRMTQFSEPSLKL